MSEHLDDFIDRFGQDEAERIVAAATEHDNYVHDDRGSDGFRWALLICIGYECMEKPRYREYHGIAAPWDDLREWMLARTEWFKGHDGDVDYITMFAGRYNEYVGMEEPA